MSMLSGVDHVATITEDLDRLAEFYLRIFDTEMVLDVTIPSVGRNAFIPIGGPAKLHAWEVEGTKPSDFGSEIFDRVDHLALAVDSHDDFKEGRPALSFEPVRVCSGFTSRLLERAPRDPPTPGTALCEQREACGRASRP